MFRWQRFFGNAKLVPQMDNRFDRPDAIQCVECGRFRVAGSWLARPPVRFEVVSHTICPDCQPSMLDELRWEMKFPSWPAEKQFEAIRLRARHVPMDALAVGDKMQCMIGVDDETRSLFLEELRPFLVDRLCPYCKQPIETDQPTASRAGYVLHKECASQLSDSLMMITALAPAEQHLDAYMDVARIPHGVRDGVRRDIELGEALAD